MAPAKEQKPSARKLFATKHGSVRAVVIGPALGWKWRMIKYYRLELSRREPGKWVELHDRWRASDNPQLAKCVADVEGFLAMQD